MRGRPMSPIAASMTETPEDTESIQAEALAFLADPATHGEPTSGVRRLSTHISEVFLVGERAFKVKKAVRFCFADFSTLEARHAACEAEIRLNRRTAPDIYIGTAAIRRGPDGKLALDEPGRMHVGKPIEWVIVMRRFDEELTFDRLAERRALKPQWIDNIIDSMIAMHARADSYDPPHGGSLALRSVIDENEWDMRRAPESFAPDRLEALIGAQRSLLVANADLLNSRRDTGHVRRCHGDLHLGNVALWHGRPLIFDCIEFSDALAVIDEIYDFSFLLMDLEARGLRNLANRALHRYFGRQAGVEALAALPLMMSLRASVRAKVTAMAANSARDSVNSARQLAKAKDLFAAAERFVAPSGPPCLVAVGGLSGTGKSTLAATLAPMLGRAPGALLLRSDVIRKRLSNVLPEDRLPATAYGPEANAEVYETVRREASAALVAGQTVIVDAVFGTEAERRAVEGAAAGAPFFGIWLEAPGSTLVARVAQRVGDASDATPEVISRQMTMETGLIKWRRLDASSPPEAVLAAAIASLPGIFGRRSHERNTIDRWASLTQVKPLSVGCEERRSIPWGGGADIDPRAE